PLGEPKIMSPTSAPSILLDLLEHAPADKVAVIIPEQQLNVTYGELRAQVHALARQLAAAGIRCGDRVGIGLPNGLPVIVAFLAASAVGTAAPLNPGYKEDEFRFYLGDTDARLLILPPEGVDDARRAAGDRVPIVSIEADANGRVGLPGNPNHGSLIPPAIDDVALVLHTSGSTGRPKRVPLTHANLSVSA